MIPQVQNQLKLQIYLTISLHILKLKLRKVSNILINTFRSDDSVFLNPTDKYEIINLISSLVPHKSTGPNSIPTKILKLLKSDISTQLQKVY